MIRQIAKAGKYYYLTRMNPIVFCLLLAIPGALSAQSPMFGLIGTHYSENYNANGDLRRVNKPLAIFYSRDYCQIHFPNGDIATFRTRAYTKTLDTARHSIHESFMNEGYGTTRAGFYMIMVDRMDGGTVFQIVGPSATMIVQNAHVYSENGQVKTGDMKIDWTGMWEQRHQSDSAAAAKEAYRQSLIRQVRGYRQYVDTAQATIPWLEDKISEVKKDSAVHSRP